MVDPRSTSTRTFLLWPMAVAVHSILTRTRADVRSIPLGLAGYLLYLFSGRYRTARGGGGPGMSTPPERLVRTGPYAYSRNPMYFGHMVTFAAFVLTTRSLAFAAIFGWHVRWFDDRAARDEAALNERFGDEYEHYRRTVPRWLPWRPQQVVSLFRRHSTGTLPTDVEARHGA